MTEYEIFGGGRIKAASRLELVEAMRNSSFTPTESLQEFMEQTANRCRLQRGSEIRTDSIENFVEDLKNNEFVTEL